jgi:hypothetical protein
VIGIEDNSLACAACLWENGIAMPDPDFSSGGAVIDLDSGDDAEFEAADAACRYLISGFTLDG